MHTPVSDQRSMVLEVSHPSGLERRIEGFRFLWAFYVNGYDPNKHCQRCLLGARVPEFSTARAMTGRRYELNQMHRYPYLYICGVAAGPARERGPKNLHLPLRFDEGKHIERVTHNDYRVRVENAAVVDVPALPDDYAGKPREHARCKNFQFGVAAFGYPVHRHAKES